MPLASRVIQEDTGRYQAIRWSTPTWQTTDDARNFERLFAASGDHLYIAEVNGSDPIQVRLGEAVNPWIRIRPGMTLKRPFTKFSIRPCNTNFSALLSGGGGMIRGSTDVLLYVSKGPLVEEAEPAPGLEQDFATQSGTFTGTVDLRTLFTNSVGSQYWPTVGKSRQGILIIKNTGLVTPFFIHSGSAGLPAGLGFKLDAGETISFRLNQRLGSPARDGLRLSVAAGVGAYSILISPLEYDTSDPSQLNRNMEVIG